MSQGLAFNTTERQILGINGLLPPAVKSDEEQITQAVTLMNRYEKDIDKYIFLNQLQVRFFLKHMYRFLKFFV